MNTSEQRITELEIKISYAEDLLDTLNTVVARQQEHMKQLLREVADLRRRCDSDDTRGFRSLRDECPPHY